MLTDRRFIFAGDKNVLKLDSSNGCTTLCITIELYNHGTVVIHGTVYLTEVSFIECELCLNKNKGLYVSVSWSYCCS